MQLLLLNEVSLIVENVGNCLFFLAQRDAGRVVAFGMGSRCPEPESVSEIGESLLDCHALSLARRAFIQYV
jgi:hypothetical protein